MLVLTATAYIFIWCSNIYLSTKKKSNTIIMLSFALMCILMCGHHYNELRGEYGLVYTGDNLDLYYYERDYALYNPDYEQYYLFFTFQRICANLSITYYEWWFIATALSLSILYYIGDKSKANLHYILSYLMIFVIALFTGLKYYYGMCIFILGYFSLISKRRFCVIEYLISLILASGMQPMYYFFMIFLIQIIKIKRIEMIAGLGLVVFLVNFINAKYAHVMGFNLNQTVGALGIQKEDFFMGETNYGFIIPIVIHLSVLLYSKVYFDIINKEDILSEKEKARNLYHSNILCFLLYPLFIYATTYTRFFTVMMILSVFITSSGFNRISSKGKMKLVFAGVISMFFFILYFVGPCNYFEFNAIPFFDNYYLRQFRNFIAGN